MDDTKLKDMIKSHEGYRPYVYYDSLGFPTGGYGHAFLDRSPISHDVALLLFEEDFSLAVEDYNKLDLQLDSVRRAVVIDMLFNLGLTRFRGFRKTIKALRRGDYDTAAKEMLDSKWAKQVKSRAFRLARMMKTGEA